MPEVLWICTTGIRPVGIVKKFNEIEQRWKYYIGACHGFDLDQDVQFIIDYGQKFYSLEFITEFCNETKGGVQHD